MIFHLAIPARDLKEAKEFYTRLGAKPGREYDTHIVLNFYGCQLVCHLSTVLEYNREPKMYPRHFGVIIDSKDEFYYTLKMCNDIASEAIFQHLFFRHEDEFAEHHTFFLKDPSNNVIEFKWYRNQEAVFT